MLLYLYADGLRKVTFLWVCRLVLISVIVLTGEMNFGHREETGEKQIILDNLLENILFVRWKNILNREHLLPRGCSSL